MGLDPQENDTEELEDDDWGYGIEAEDIIVGTLIDIYERLGELDEEESEEE